MNKEYTSNRKNSKKRGRVLDPRIQSITKVVSPIANQIKHSIETFSKIISVDSDVFKSKKKINKEIKRLSGITTSERFKVINIISRDDDKTILFFAITDDEKEEWVRVVLNGDI